MRQGLAVLTTIALAGCGGPSGPPSTDTSSDALPSLERRVEFLERYPRRRAGSRDQGMVHWSGVCGRHRPRALGGGVSPLGALAKARRTLFWLRDAPPKQGLEPHRLYCQVAL
jgi:hypothetical protein